MKRNIIIILVIQLLVSCSNRNVTIITDPWWNDSYQLEYEIKKNQIQEFFKSGTIIGRKTFETEEEIITLLENIPVKGENPEVFIMSPIFFSLINDVAQIEEKNANFIFLNGYYETSADNLIAVYSSREEMYFQAGISAAEFSFNNDNCKVSAVFYTGSRIRRLEKESFQEGYESIEEKGTLDLYEQPTYTGSERLKKFINTASGNGTGLFFFSASSLNPYCLDIAKPLSIAISGENLNSLGLHNELIEFSIDDDMVELVKTAIEIGVDGDITNDIPVKCVISKKGIHF